MKWLLLPLVLVGCMGSDTKDIVGPFTGPAHRFVVDRFSLPTTHEAATAIGDDLDGDDHADNVLGHCLATLATDDNLTTHADDMVASGAITSIVEIQADDLQNDPSVGVRYFGADGDATSVVGGSIAGGIFVSNRTSTTRVAGRAVLRLPVFADASPSVVVLDAMELSFDPDGVGGLDARVRGGVAADVLVEAARGLIEMIDANPAGHPYARALLDADHDGHVTIDEVTANSLIRALLAPDVDVFVDGNRVERVSFGFGVHLIACDAGDCALRTPTATCFDRVVDGDESDIDCGGSCRACAGGAACRASADCQSQSCAGTCAAPSCTDGIQDGYETDVDCGWGCPGCPRFARCHRNEDCASQHCGSDGVCF
jgi:hypothetical protein